MKNIFKKEQQQSQIEVQKSILNERLDRTVENQNSKRKKYIQKLMALQQKQESCFGGRHPEHSQFFQNKIRELEEKIKNVDSKEKLVIDFQITFDGLLSQLLKLEGQNPLDLDEKTRNDNFTILCSLKRQAFNLQKQFEQKQFLLLLNSLIDSINQYQENYKQAGVNVKADIDREEIQQILSQVEQHRNMRRKEKDERKRERKKHDREYSGDEDNFFNGQFDKNFKKHKQPQMIQQQEPIKPKQLVEQVIIQNDFQQQQQIIEKQQLYDKPNRNKKQERQDQNDRNDKQHRKNRQDKQDKYDQQFVQQKYDYQNKYIERQQKQQQEQVADQNIKQQDIFQDFQQKQQQFQQKQQQFQQIIVEEKHSELQAVIDQLNQKLQIKEEQNRKLNELQKQQKQEEMKQLAEENLCQICFNKKKEYVAVPCGHFAYCGECKSMVKKECLICRSPCQQLLKIFS